MFKKSSKSNALSAGSGKDHKCRCVSRRDFLMAGSGLVVSAALPFGCGGEKKDAGQNAASNDAEALGTIWADTRSVLNLADVLHLADIDHFGEFADFGTAARYKYTLGGWMSGFSGDTDINGVTFTWAAESPGRIYFTAEKATPLSFVFRVKKGGTDYFSVYLNDKPLQRVSFKGSDWEEHRVEAPAEAVVPGENYLKFIFQTSEEKVGDKPASFAVDYLRIIPDGADAKEGQIFAPPYLAGMRGRYEAGKKERDALLLPAPAALSYYLDVPADARLCFAASTDAVSAAKEAPPNTVEVTVTPVDGGGAKKVLELQAPMGQWTEKMVDLSEVAGKLVRVRIETKGASGTRTVIAEPAMRVGGPGVSVPPKKMKNAIVVLIDTLRADKLTAYARTRVRTPVFEKFAKESTLFEDCQAPSNWTKPSCGSVLTGLYPDTHKARGHGSKVAGSVKLASEIFQTAGFATGAFIANGYLAAEFGFDRGWTHYTNFIREKKQTEAENVYKESLEFIEKNKDKRFFAYIQTIDPHVPYDPPEEDLKLYDAQSYDGVVHNRSTGNLLEEIKRKKVEMTARDKARLEALYDGEVTYHDRHFGHFLDGLNKLGVLDDTAIIVCSDHGEEFFEHDSVGHGHTLFEELVHVPLAIRAPELVPAGERRKGAAGLSDILPTALSATGLERPRSMEGRDLLGVANGEVPALLDAGFSSFYSEADGRNLSWSVRKGDFKLRMHGPARTYLYNLAADPGEREDVDEKYPLALRALRIAIGQFIGAPDKHDWTSSKIAAQVVGHKTKEEEATVPEDLKEQLRALGYMQ